MSASVPVPAGYAETLERLKDEIGTARARAVLAVNGELVGLYWRIGREILRRQRDEGWGAQVIQRLADDLRAHFPDLKGLSRSNLYSMRAFAETWSEEDVHQLGGQLPWRHQVALLQKLDSRQERLFTFTGPLSTGGLGPSWKRRSPRSFISARVRR